MTAGMGLFSCKKEKSNDQPACAVNVANISGAYKLTALQYKASATSAPVDYYAYTEDCEKDDILTFKSDGTYDYNDAGTACTPVNNDHGTWQLNGNVLTKNGDGEQLNATIESYDCKSKTLVYYVENGLKTGDRLTFTWVKQ